MFELTPYERRHQRALFNPFRDMENFEKNFWGDMAATDFKTDIKDNGKEYVLEAELPGFKKEDIHVDIEDGYMTISAERSNETEKKDDKGNFVRRERSYGSFSRSFDVSSVKTEDITGEYKDGVLTLTMPKKEENVPTSRRIEIPGGNTLRGFVFLYVLFIRVTSSRVFSYNLQCSRAR